MATLELGVLDQAYSHIEGHSTKVTTTYEVAQILEDNYHVMGTFYALKQEKIANFLADSIGNAFQDRIQGRTIGRSPTYDAEQKIEALFRSFLDANEMNKLSIALTGIAISAVAARGYSKRRKRNPLGRPAFIDTGTYRISFRCIFKP